MSNVWYLDNGTSNHMTGDASKFKELDEKVTGRVKFGDGSTVEIKGKGLVSFKCKNGDEIVLQDVYYIPTLCSNILSLGQLYENGKKVILNGIYLWVDDEQRRLLMKVKRSENRLYKIVLETSQNKCLMSSAEEKSWLWHSRLGHVNFQAIGLLSDNHMAYGLPKFVKPEGVCTGCYCQSKIEDHFQGRHCSRRNNLWNSFMLICAGQSLQQHWQVTNTGR